MIILLAITVISCQSDPFSRPVEPIGIANGDGTTEYTLRDRSWTQTETTGDVCTPIESYGRVQKYVLDLEERLRSCELKL